MTETTVSRAGATFTYVRMYLTRAIIIVTCVAVLVAWYLLPQSWVDPTAPGNEVILWNTAVSAWTLFIGILTLGRHYILSILKRAQYWPYMTYAIILMPAWTIMGIYFGLYSDFYQTAYLSTKITLHIAILGQLVFFLISGSYRVLRMKSFRTTLYAVFYLIIVVCNASWMLAAIPQSNPLAYWLLQNPAMAMQRTLTIAGACGGVVLSMRILMGLEKGSLRATEGA